MVKFFRNSSKKIGAPPGELVHIGEKRDGAVKIHAISYNEQACQVRESIKIEDCCPCKDETCVNWISVDGIHEVEVVEKIGKAFDLHPLLLEDILNTNQRSKIEDFEKYIFIVLKRAYYDEEEDEIGTEQISLVLGSNFVISFREQERYVYQPIKERIVSGKGKIRRMRSDYLAYAIVDAIVDNYFIILEKIGEKLEDLEDELLTEPSNKTLEEIHRLKRYVTVLRKAVWPVREVVNGMLKSESPLFQEATEIFLRDVYDHTVHIIETADTYRDMLSSMLDLYISSVSNKMNEVMKVLTIIATIFIPLTFIAGLYGMNFKFMPELEWRWGYFAILGIMFLMGFSMLVFFRIKKWF